MLTSERSEPRVTSSAKPAVDLRVTTITTDATVADVEGHDAMFSVWAVPGIVKEALRKLFRFTVCIDEQA